MMVVVPNYLSERIDKRIAEIVDQFPDVDTDWLRNEILIQALENNVSPEAVSVAPAQPEEESSDE